MAVVVWLLKQWIDHSLLDPLTRDKLTARGLFVKSEEGQEANRSRKPSPGLSFAKRADKSESFSNNQETTTMNVLIHHIYDFRKGLWSLVMHTLSSRLTCSMKTIPKRMGITCLAVL